ncbi:MAG TPA: serine dehydratase subunit alpha family protein [Tepidimicrobium sp.]|nr:serine dehydratase subunit alpha family protein [Tepidimicrobium sp.]
MKTKQKDIYNNLMENREDRPFVDLLQVLKEGVRPALGCTEPVALGLGVAEAYRHLEGELIGIDIELSPNIYKNGMGVGIPGTDEKGLIFAAGLAIACGDATLGLEVFKNVDDSHVARAKEIIENKDINIRIQDGKGSFYIKAKVVTDQGEGICIIEDNHTNIVLVRVNDEIIFEKERSKDRSNENPLAQLVDITLKDIIEFVEKVPFDDIQFMLEGVRVNMDIARKGLEEGSGAGLGAAMNSLMEEGEIEKDVVTQARILTSAACDARMAGVNMPVMSSAGSGNNGITAIIPTTVVCEQLGYDDEKLARALAFSHLMTSYIKAFIGVLSPICSCAIAAGIGASASITWLMGGTEKQIEGAIKNMIGSISGMICDGAKGGCAFKLSTAASEAIIQAKLARANIFISDFDGIVSSTADLTIRNLGRFCSRGMKDMDKEIIEIMAR